VAEKRARAAAAAEEAVAEVKAGGADHVSGESGALQWYAVHVADGCEEKARQQLQAGIDGSDCSDKFGAVAVPSDIVEADATDIVYAHYPDGKILAVDPKEHSSLLFVHMEMCLKAWRVVRTTPEILGFVDAKKWYAAHVTAGSEAKARDLLADLIKASDLQDMFGEIELPVEKVEEYREGRRVKTDRKLYPSYLFIRMTMCPDTWHFVCSTPKIHGFIGGDSRNPRPMKDADMDAIKRVVREGAEKPRPKVMFHIGERIHIKEGPFNDFFGNIEEINYDRNKLKISVNVLGRATLVELDFGHIEKA
jgi:transcriptional antiterminator NusG